MKLFKHAVYNKPSEESLEDVAREIVDRLAPRWPWEDVHESHIDYVLSMLRRISYERD